MLKFGGKDKKKHCIPNYDITVEPHALMAMLKIIGSSVNWPKQMLTPTNKRDYNKFYRFRNDHAHQTEYCISLRYEIISILRKRTLRDFLIEKGRQALKKGEQNKEHESKSINMPDEPPNVDRVIGVIHRGIKVDGLTQTTLKRHSQELNNVNSMSAGQ